MPGCRRPSLLAIDAAYAEFVTRNDYEPGIELVEAAQNVVMLRTFSKIYALGGLRLGWAYCPAPIADVLNRVRSPFNVNAAAQAAGVAALADVAAVDRAREHNDIWLPWFTRELRALGLTVNPSVGNFVIVRFPDAPVAQRRRRLRPSPIARHSHPQDGILRASRLAAHHHRDRGRDARRRRRHRRLPRWIMSGA